MDRYLRWARHEYALRTRLTVLILLAPLFLVVLPFLLVRGARELDTRFRVRRLGSAKGNRVAGALLGLSGALLGFSSVSAVVDASGTPLPVMPTQRLVVRGPFAWCRNPMTLGTILGYLGIAVWLGSASAVGIVAALGAALLLRLKLVEERELTARFGAAYLEYKRRTPFLLPRVPRR